ncbi:sialic acid synthase isoform X2 [Anthonomus grandis grandis]|uniref:sialic acid synthase isoform X2 n=1 Tax=Anthonomus grandis grandis TaxID=2921223 RepID=UPI002165B318|nr:sialic acid synthase isoform X2 [Anthonomus grandis grandis]
MQAENRRENKKDSGADCVKLQKTCAKEKFTKSALSAPYVGPNSWGKTYGEHKDYLEFSADDFLELQAYAKKLDIHLTASAMDEVSLKFLEDIKVPFIKIGSGDSNNLFLIEEAAKSGTPLIISTGMSNMQTIEKIYKLVSKYHKKFALLHCISAYPTPYDSVHLKVIQEMQKKFQDIIIGYSGHELDLHVTVAAVALGAKIIERHITLDKAQKGSDHSCSLEPNELQLLIKQIRDVELALGEPDKEIRKCEHACFEKLGKSLVYSKNLKVGHEIRKQDLKVKVSIPKGFDPLKYEEILGQKLLKDVVEDEAVHVKHHHSL